MLPMVAYYCLQHVYGTVMYIVDLISHRVRSTIKSSPLRLSSQYFNFPDLL